MRSLGRVLVVDVEPELRETLGEIVKTLGYEAITAASGDQAIVRLPAKPP